MWDYKALARAYTRMGITASDYRSFNAGVTAGALGAVVPDLTALPPASLTNSQLGRQGRQLGRLSSPAVLSRSRGNTLIFQGE